MKLKITVLTLLCALCGSLSAQQYLGSDLVAHNLPKTRTFCGVMAGVTAPQLSERIGDLDINNNLGFNLGIMWGVDFGSVEITPEIWYQHNKLEIYDKATHSGGELTSNSIEMPVIVALKFGMARFNFGPSFALMTSNKLDSAREVSVEFGDTKSLGGYVVGMSVTFTNNIILDVRYTGRFSSKRSEWFEGGAPHEYRHSSFGANVGYRF